MSIATSEPLLNELIARLDKAVEIKEATGCCQAVKEALEEIVASQQDFIAERFLQPAPDKYARRLVHKDPQDRYTVLAMVWGSGQGTAVHDHDDLWCVECVYRGKIKVVSYSYFGEEKGLHQFQPAKVVYAGLGEAGALIPPYDHHTIENEEATPAVTLHVYGGEMQACHAFIPVEGGYRRERRELSYTD